MGVPRLPERHSPLLVDSYTHEFKQQHKMPNKGSKKAKKSGSNIFSLFSQKQIQEFKEAFGIIDKDGIITAPDPKKAFEGIGRPISDGEANNMVGEAPGPINFTQMVTLFAEKMSGGTDDDDVIIRSFEAFEINGQIDAEMFRHSLMTWGEKFSANEIDDAFAEFKIDGGMIDGGHLKSIMWPRRKERNNSHHILMSSCCDIKHQTPSRTGACFDNMHPLNNISIFCHSKMKMCIEIRAKKPNNFTNQAS